MTLLHVTLALSGIAGETFFGDPVEDRPGHFQVQNILYFAYGLHFQDIVEASPVDGILEVKRVVRRSGQMTLRFLFESPAEAQVATMTKLRELGFRFSRANENLVSATILESELDRVEPKVLELQNEGFIFEVAVGSDGYGFSLPPDPEADAGFSDADPTVGQDRRLH